MPSAPRPAGRLAPSPTGGLHVGHARTFLFAWLSARRVGGRVVLRIEDIDGSRSRPEAITGALTDLSWLGLDWDEGPDVGGPHAPYLQSLRRDRYAACLEVLKRAEIVYPCTCSRADIARAASAPHLEDEGPRYPGTCSGRSVSDAFALTVPYAWRFRVPDRPVAWDDGVSGPISFGPRDFGGDFVVGRSTGEPAYQLAVVHDDAAMGITEVIRGDDLLRSTPRQLLLYEALGWVPPTFAHVPLVHGPDGRRLAKRDGSIKLATLRERGVDPRQLIGLMARSFGGDAIDENDSPGELLRQKFPPLPGKPWHLPESWLESLRQGGSRRIS